jgi:hypothetical protein
MRGTIQKDSKDDAFYHVYYEASNRDIYLGTFHQDNLADIAAGTDTSWYESLGLGEAVDCFLRISETVL